MSTIGITSSLLSQIVSSPSTSNQFVTDLNQLAQDLQNGNLSGAQQDYVTLSQDALNGATSSAASSSASGITASLLSDIASSPDSSTSFVDELDQLGGDLENGDLTSAQDDMLNLDSTALNAASSAGTASSTNPAASSSATQTNTGEATQLIQAIVQALQAGDSSVVSSAMSELASISPSSAGASVLEQESENYGSGSGSASSNSISQLMQSLDTSDAGGSTSALSLLA